MFENLKVLELASVLAGPGVGSFLQNLGATVIKVENPKTSGDVPEAGRLQVRRRMTDPPIFALLIGEAVNCSKSG
jgi:crotonobetainyl-CoA:carnitine CoA-transferase CaiB-like acyl-CoA transferase